MAYNIIMRILTYLVCGFALFAAVMAGLTPLPVDAQGCAGGNCGITTTITPSAGPTGSQVNMTITSGAYPLDGRYEIWWSKSPTMSDDPTAVKMAEGWNERMKQTFSVSVSIPEATNGLSYFHYIKAGRTEQMMNFAFQVTPSITLQSEKLALGDDAALTGTGFTPNDEVTFFVDGEPIEFSMTTDKNGSFNSQLPIPALNAGTHVIKAIAKRMFNQEASTRFKVNPFIKVEPERPSVGDKATLTGYGFAANTEVSIKYDDVVVTNSPSSDKNGYFIYNFTVPETSADTHAITASDKLGNTITWNMPVESNPPSTPTPISPTSDRLGVVGKQQVIFNWMPSKDDSGTVLYNLQVAENMNFFPLMPGMARTNLEEPMAVLDIEPGTYYWRVQAVDGAGNKSKWALSPYAFQVGLINLWLVIGVSLVLIVVFILLLRAFIQRIRGYYY